MQNKNTLLWLKAFDELNSTISNEMSLSKHGICEKLGTQFDDAEKMRSDYHRIGSDIRKSMDQLDIA